MSIIQKTRDFIKMCFIDGVLTILPVVLTIWFFSAIFRYTKAILNPIYLREPQFLKNIPHSEIIVVILAILLIGAIFRTYLIKSFLLFLESALLKVPLVSVVYSGIKQLVQAFAIPEKLTFKKVVLVEFPRMGIHSIGFLTNEAPPFFKDDIIKRHLVFIPTTPNPTTGFLIIVPENELTIINITRQEAMSLIISGGIIQPTQK